MTPILWSALLGVGLILVLGIILALAASLFPRLLSRWEGPVGARLNQEELRPAPSLPLQERAPSPAASEASAAAAGPEDSLMAAAIALALSLYHGEADRMAEPLPRTGGLSSWALAGRWQAMQSRLNMRKR